MLPITATSWSDLSKDFAIESVWYRGWLELEKWNSSTNHYTLSEKWPQSANHCIGAGKTWSFGRNEVRLLIDGQPVAVGVFSVTLP